MRPIAAVLPTNRAAARAVVASSIKRRIVVIAPLAPPSRTLVVAIRETAHPGLRLPVVAPAELDEARSRLAGRRMD